MSQPMDDLIAGGTVDVPVARPRRGPKIAFILALLLSIPVLAGFVGSSALTGIGNLFGFELDAAHCELYRPMSCSSVALSAINRVSRADFPQSAEVANSYWAKTLKSGYLGALVKVNDEKWAPPSDTYDPCTCSGETPSFFEEKDITVSAEYGELTPRNNGLQRHLFIGTDASGTMWVIVDVLLNN